jgi:hypothetical protein
MVTEVVQQFWAAMARASSLPTLPRRQVNPPGQTHFVRQHQAVAIARITCRVPLIRTSVLKLSIGRVSACAASAPFPRAWQVSSAR